MSLTIDHIVILVNDLEQASANYAALGFTVTPGGEHTGGATHNALIAFADRSYLELIAFKRPAPEHAWWRHTTVGEGLIDFALLPDDINAVIGGAQERGLPFEGPFPGGRLRPDGQAIAWHIGRPPTSDLPFLCADVTSRELRVPTGAAQQHANGVIGIADVIVAVADLQASAVRYQALLGADTPVALPDDDSISDHYIARFALGASTVTLVGPQSSVPIEETLRTQLADRGDGLYGLMLKLNGSMPITPDLERTNGVRLGFVTG
jgi:catechol 2,3-dioxygenase-like lactoylglutathione lyase family enzyme